MEFIINDKKHENDSDKVRKKKIAKFRDKVIVHLVG